MRQPLILILCIELGSSVHRVFKAATDRSVQATLKADNLGKREYTQFKTGKKTFRIIKTIRFVSEWIFDMQTKLHLYFTCVVSKPNLSNTGGIF